MKSIGVTILRRKNRVEEGAQEEEEEDFDSVLQEFAGTAASSDNKTENNR